MRPFLTPPGMARVTPRQTARRCRCEPNPPATPGSARATGVGERMNKAPLYMLERWRYGRGQCRRSGCMDEANYLDVCYYDDDLGRRCRLAHPSCPTHAAAFCKENGLELPKELMVSKFRKEKPHGSH